MRSWKQRNTYSFGSPDSWKSHTAPKQVTTVKQAMLIRQLAILEIGLEICVSMTMCILDFNKSTRKQLSYNRSTNFTSMLCTILCSLCYDRAYRSPIYLPILSGYIFITELYTNMRRPSSKEAQCYFMIKLACSDLSYFRSNESNLRILWNVYVSWM